MKVSQIKEQISKLDWLDGTIRVFTQPHEMMLYSQNEDTWHEVCSAMYKLNMDGVWTMLVPAREFLQLLEGMNDDADLPLKVYQWESPVEEEVRNVQ